MQRKRLSRRCAGGAPRWRCSRSLRTYRSRRRPLASRPTPRPTRQRGCATPRSGSPWTGHGGRRGAEDLGIGTRSFQGARGHLRKADPRGAASGLPRGTPWRWNKRNWSGCTKSTWRRRRSTRWCRTTPAKSSNWKPRFAAQRTTWEEESAVAGAERKEQEESLKKQRQRENRGIRIQEGAGAQEGAGQVRGRRAPG